MTRTLLAALLFATALGGCKVQEKPDTLDAIARDYVLLSLTIGEKEEGYIDAYYGPPELQAQAKAEAAGHSLEALSKRAAELSKRIAEAGRGAEGMDRRRARFLAAQLTAAATRLRMLRGEKLSFEDEAQGLFGVRPQPKPLASYDPLLTKVEALVPGGGPLRGIPAPLHHSDGQAEAGVRRGNCRVQGTHGPAYWLAPGRAVRPWLRHRQELVGL